MQYEIHKTFRYSCQIHTFLIACGLYILTCEAENMRLEEEIPPKFNPMILFVLAQAAKNCPRSESFAWYKIMNYYCQYHRDVNGEPEFYLGISALQNVHFAFFKSKITSKNLEKIPLEFKVEFGLNVTTKESENPCTYV